MPSSQNDFTNAMKSAESRRLGAADCLWFSGRCGRAGSALLVRKVFHQVAIAGLQELAVELQA